MKLFELLNYLAAQDPAKRIPLGFGDPIPCHSVFSDVAFPPKYDVLIGQMLASASSAVDATMTAKQGSKEVQVTIRKNTDCWLGHPGQPCNILTPELMAFLTGYPGKVS